MTPNPITDIEDEKGQKDLGVFMARVYQGAYEESGSYFTALQVVTAFMAASLSIPRDEGGDTNA